MGPFGIQAGITTTLNSRCAVFAAANSVFGRWDDTKGEENIDFMPTILSRFDTIFIVKDEHNESRDMVIRLVQDYLLNNSVAYSLCHLPDFGQTRHGHPHECCADDRRCGRRRVEFAIAQEIHRVLSKVNSFVSAVGSSRQLKRFRMCYSRCGPRLSEAAAEKLKNRYVLMRSGVRDHEMESEKRLNIPITVRSVSRHGHRDEM